MNIIVIISESMNGLFELCQDMKKRLKMAGWDYQAKCSLSLFYYFWDCSIIYSVVSCA